MKLAFQKVLARIFLFVTGWKIDGQISDLGKCVIIGAPHTSNWDFVYGMIFKFYYGLDICFMMKKELFRFPLRCFFSGMGAIPVDRMKHENKVGMLCNRILNADTFYLAISPEGTRKAVKKWKTGFYYIAKQSGIPIALGYIDYGEKVVGIGPVFYPGDDLSRDMKVISQFYATKKAKYPENFHLPVT